MCKILISIIIPVYNAEKTIQRTLASLIHNNERIEIICVNDGSTDDSENVIYSMMKHDKRIRYVKQNNQGASAARNNGICHANGEFIMFCDADDEYDNNALLFIKEDIISKEPDFIVFERRTVFQNNRSFDRLKNNNELISIKTNWVEYLNNIFFQREHSTVVCNKVYKASIIMKEKVCFDKGLVLGEDLLFNIAYLKNVKLIVEDGRAIYVQHKVDNSLTSIKRPDYFEQDTIVIKRVKDLYYDYVESLIPFLDRHILNTTIIACDRALNGRDATSIREKRKIIKRVIEDAECKLAYDRSINRVDIAMKRKLNLLFHKHIFVYHMLFILLPRIKGGILNFFRV